ncbi:MAG: DUF962 domain-containing protein [Myxococcales bacterium]|nr:DUF962 domain-containing protein [Myxococcales bacterium]
MRTYAQWMDAYGESHQNPQNQMIHKICVPLIMMSVFGMLWAIPIPWASSPISLWVNWATIGAALGLAFYFSLNVVMALGMIVQIAVMLGVVHAFERFGVLLPASVGVFVLAWIGQFYGHKIEGKKPSFFDDLAFLLIGPLWVQRFLYARIGIKA